MTRPEGPEGPVVVLLNRDLRVHDHPALVAALSRGTSVIPLFVIDPRLLASPRSANRAVFLLECLVDLRQSLERMGGQLFVREGDPVEQAMRMIDQSGASALHVSEDVGPVAQRRQDRLAEACRRARVHFAAIPGTTVVPAGGIRPAGGDHHRVFTPYWNRWKAVPRRQVLTAPDRVACPPDVAPGRIHSVAATRGKPLSPDRPRGGETAARQRARRWLDAQLSHYPGGHDDLPGDRTSRLSPYLHFGCLSPTALARQAEDLPGGQEFVRQLCWRDFHHQVLDAFPDLGVRDYHPRPNRSWASDPAAVEAWKEGRTGVPIVDAGMRQLRTEGWMHNRARLLTASYLTRDLGVHWRVGADHFMDWLTDADVANNYGNWQWVAGTGNDTRPNRRFNLQRQARRLDPTGDYVRRYVPEAAGPSGPIGEGHRCASAHP
jgi:deoxyribodipyrimidine photo-lyase